MQPTLTWLLTSTTYGTWLPGDTRGFVGRVVEARADDPLTEHRVEHDRPQTDYDRDIPALRAAAQQQMKGEPILRVDLRILPRGQAAVQRSFHSGVS